MPITTPKAGRPPVEDMPLPMLLGKTILSEGGMDAVVIYAIL